MVDWMADYLELIRDMPITPDVHPGEIRNKLPVHPPLQGEAFSAIFQDFLQLIVPGMTHWNHPGWFAYFPANHSPPSILAEMLTATLGAQCMSWQTSPAATELEQLVLSWLRQMLQLPPTWTGTIQDTASSSTLVALLTARERATQHHYGQLGPTTPLSQSLVVYTSEQAHSSVDKGVKLAGFGLERLRKIATDAHFAMNPVVLEQTIEQDIQAGLVPACVVATLGTTSSAAIDSLAEIGPICRKYKTWLHVDAAYGGSAAILPEMQHLLSGIEHADSFVFNPHKWLLTNFDCSAYFVQDVDTLLRTFRSDPEYLKTVYDPEVVNFRDWGIPLGRRFRALKLWFVLRSYGVEGLQQHLRQHIAWAKELASWIEDSPLFSCMAPVSLGLLCLRYTPPHLAPEDPRVDTLNEQLLRAVNAHRRFHLTHTRLHNQYTIRVSIGQHTTTHQDVADLWTLLQQEATSLLPEHT